MKKVGVTIVRELYGVVAAENATSGVVITSGTFTQEAQMFARGKALELIDGPRLVRMISGVQKSPGSVSQKTQMSEDDDNVCPLCGKRMVLRTAKKGSTAGQKFWGCSGFPKCTYTKSYSEM